MKKALSRLIRDRAGAVTGWLTACTQRSLPMAHAVLKSFELLTSDLSVQALDKNFSVRTGTRLAHGRRKGCQRCSTVWLPLRFIFRHGIHPPRFPWPEWGIPDPLENSLEQEPVVFWCTASSCKPPASAFSTAWLKKERAPCPSGSGKAASLQTNARPCPARRQPCGSVRRKDDHPARCLQPGSVS